MSARSTKSGRILGGKSLGGQTLGGQTSSNAMTYSLRSDRSNFTLLMSPEMTAKIRRRMFSIIMACGALLLVVGFIVYLTQTGKRPSSEPEDVTLPPTPSGPGPRITDVTTLPTEESTEPPEATTEPPPRPSGPVIKSFKELQEYYGGKLHEECGQRDPHFRPRPWYLEIYTDNVIPRSYDSYEFLCGAVLVSADWLLTPSECAHKINNTPPLPNGYQTRFYLVAGHVSNDEAQQELRRLFGSNKVRYIDNAPVHELGTGLSLVKLELAFMVPVREDSDVAPIMVNTICLPPPILPPQSGFDKDDEFSGLRDFYELVGHNKSDKTRFEEDVRKLRQIRMRKADLTSRRTQDFLPDDTLHVTGPAVTKMCQIGVDGSPLFSVARMFGQTDRLRVYLDALLYTVSDPIKCTAEPLEAVFRNVSVSAPLISSYWKSNP